MPDDDYAINRVEWLEPFWKAFKARVFRRRPAPVTPAPKAQTQKTRPAGAGGVNWGDRALYKDPYRG